MVLRPLLPVPHHLQQQRQNLPTAKYGLEEEHGVPEKQNIWWNNSRQRNQRSLALNVGKGEAGSPTNFDTHSATQTQVRQDEVRQNKETYTKSSKKEISLIS